MNNEEKISSEEIAVRGGFLGWLDNFWYHYKWPTIGGIFLIIVLLVGVTQCMGKTEEDIVVLYAGRNQLSVAEADNVCSVLEAIAPKKDNKNSNIGITYYHVLNEEQIKEIQAETDENGKPKYTVDKSYVDDQHDKYYQSLLTGDNSVIFVEPWLYEKLVRDNRLVALKDVLGYLPENAIGEHGVRLGDLELYGAYGALKAMDADTVVCILHPNSKITFSKNSKDSYYENEKALFRAIIEYKAPEET